MATRTTIRKPSVLTNCEACGREFRVKQSTLGCGRGRCCSRACHNKWRTGRSRAVNKTRSDKQPRRSYVCQWCGKVFANESHDTKARQFCSNKCSGKSRRKDRRNKPRRKQNNELTRWAKAVILRDQKCVRCGAKDRLQAHHVKSYAKHPDFRLDLDNGVALCPVCHHAQHPKHRLGLYLSRHGYSVHRCVACEAAFIPWKDTQRTCSISCGRKLFVSKTSMSDTYTPDDRFGTEPE